MEVANFIDQHRNQVTIDKLNDGKYCVTVNGRMTQKDLGPDQIIGWFANASMHNPGSATRQELIDVLRETRRLVVKAACTGFDEESCRAIFINNGAITRAVPLRPQDREESLAMVENTI